MNLAFIAASSAQQAEDFRSEYKRPASIPFPDDNPYSEEKAHLGKLLFFDPRLSKENNISCASCHNPSFGWEDAQDLGIGTAMERLPRHTPTVLNLAWGSAFFWDGRAATLEEQALGPMQAGGEMASDLDQLLDELAAIEGYRELFAEVFPDEGITGDTMAKAIATYERTIVSSEAPFDRWVNGDESAISAEAKQGFVLFNTKAGCAECHSGWNMTDDSFHDIGLPATEDVGRYSQIAIDPMMRAFKTPGLRNITERAPYMHDGSLATLGEVIDHYAGGFERRESLSSSMVDFELSAEEKQALIAFLETLTSEDGPVTYPVLPAPARISADAGNQQGSDE